MLRMLNIENLNDREKAKIFANEIVEIQGDLLSPVKEDSYNLLGRICLIEKTETKDGDCLKYFEKSLAINSNYSNTYDGLI